MSGLKVCRSSFGAAYQVFEHMHEAGGFRYDARHRNERQANLKAQLDPFTWTSQRSKLKIVLTCESVAYETLLYLMYIAR
jgi:hypothetical protein